MSNNSRSLGHPEATGRIGTEGNLPIFAVKYQGYAIAVLKDPDFSTTIVSILKAFPALTDSPASHVRLFSRFDDFGDLLVELRQDVWHAILPSLKVVEVLTRIETGRENGAQLTTSTLEDDITDLTNLSLSDKILVHVIGGPIDLTFSISETFTIGQLKIMVFENEPSLPRNLVFSNQGVDLTDDEKHLREYDIVDQSIISMATNVQVYVTTPDRSKVPMRITLYAKVSSLKLLVNAKLEIPVYKQILVCAGEELDDATQLGSYHQIIHNCQIFVDRLVTSQLNQPQLSLLYPIKVEPEWAAADDEDGDSHLVFSSSTVLDLKVLVSNLNMIIPSRQSLHFRGQSLEDHLPLGNYQIKPGDTITMKVRSQAT